MADDYVTAYIGGQTYTGYGVATQNSQSVIKYVDAGMLLIALAVRETSGGTGGMSIVVLVNDRVVAVSGDSFPAAKMNFNFNPADLASAGWSTDLNFDESSWSPWTATCAFSNTWYAAMTNLTAGTTGLFPNFFMGS